MVTFKSALETNAKILKSQVNKYALIGLGISVTAIMIATLIVAYQLRGVINYDSIIQAQSNNIALIILDTTPILFMFWGQSVSTMMSYTASAMVLDQTNELRMQTSGLESKVEHAATHDKLTDLPNRLLFRNYLEQMIANKIDGSDQMALLVLSFQNFRELNTAFGSANADKLIVQFVEKLQAILDPSMLFSRISDDQFAILLVDITKNEQILKLIKKIQRIMKRPFILNGIEVDLNTVVGATVFPENGQDSEKLIQRALIAVYHALNSVNEYAFYSVDMDNSSQNQLILLSELRKALEDKRLDVYFQPIINLATGLISHCEALICWQHPTFGSMNAEKFIPIAEQTGLIKVITNYVLEESISQAKQWHEKGYDLTVSVNLSAVDLIDHHLPSTIHELLKKYQYPANKLKLELIESAYLNKEKQALDVINQLSALGVKIAIDDFGTGYSSFLYLSKLPIHEIKIDKSFIMTMHIDKKNRDIVEAILKLAQSLSLNVVAEGVHQPQHLDFLIEHGCNYAQGFLFSKALKANDFIQLVDLGNMLPVPYKAQVKMMKST